MNLLDSMRYLVALEQHRHFGRAASACHITQPALSNALRALEAELGVAIVRRGRSYEGLTVEGERVLASANRLLHEQELLRQDLHSTRDAPRGALAIGVVPTAVPVAARFAARLQALHPGIRPVVRSLSSPEIESGLAGLSLDLGLGYTERMSAPGRQGPQTGPSGPKGEYRSAQHEGTPVSPRARLEAVPQYEERYFLLRRAGRETAMRWREAAALPLVLLTPEMHNRRIVDAAFHAAGVEVQPSIETNSIVTLVMTVLEGQVSAVLPGALLALARQHGALVASPLEEPDVRTPIGFMYAAEARPSRALEAALALARDADWLAHAVIHGGQMAPADSRRESNGSPN